MSTNDPASHWLTVAIHVNPRLAETLPILGSRLRSSLHLEPACLKPGAKGNNGSSTCSQKASAQRWHTGPPFTPYWPKQVTQPGLVSLGWGRILLPPEGPTTNTSVCWCAASWVYKETLSTFRLTIQSRLVSILQKCCHNSR